MIREDFIAQRVAWLWGTRFCMMLGPVVFFSRWPFAGYQKSLQYSPE